ncbi:MAG: nucleoside hydrolase, partial [Arenimonas sp.]|nr:nucleoside hydrolase [Arenimonas sp.]
PPPDHGGGRGPRAEARPWAGARPPDGVSRAEDRYLAVELEGRHSRGATLVDWQRRMGRPANARIVMDYDQAQFEALVRSGLGA